MKNIELLRRLMFSYDEKQFAVKAMELGFRTEYQTIGGQNMLVVIK